MIINFNYDELCVMYKVLEDWCYTHKCNNCELKQVHHRTDYVCTLEQCVEKVLIEKEKYERNNRNGRVYQL